MDEVFTHDVFLSHSSADKAVVREIAERLRVDGLRVWFDEWEILPADSIPAKIEEGLEHSRVLVLCMSIHAFGSDWAQLETGTFRFRDPLNKQRRFIPLRLDETPPPGSLAQFKHISWLAPDRDREYAVLFQTCQSTNVQPRPDRETVRERVGPIYAGTFGKDKNALLRASLVRRVRRDWVDGFLLQSLENIPYLDLELEIEPGAIAWPWDPIVQRQKPHSTTLPRGTKITSVFDKRGGSLLILGGAGSGKTTLLLELTRDLLDRAERDISKPTPVYLNLTSWSSSYADLAEWMASELFQRYQLPLASVRAWIQEDLVLPLLDGLDEVASECRQHCVAALNKFCSSHAMLPIVVCGRTEEYQTLGDRLRFSTAVAIRPIPIQIAIDYFHRLGPPLSHFAQVLENDVDLQELFQNPLILSVATLAYGDSHRTSVPPGGSLEEVKNQIFSTYVEAMLRRRRRNDDYNDKSTTKWLSWLAQSLIRHNQTVFQLDSLRPHWLSKWIHSVAVELICATFLALCYGLFLGLVVTGALRSQGTTVISVRLLLTAFCLFFLAVVLMMRWVLGGWFPEIFWRWQGFSLRRVLVDFKTEGIRTALTGGFLYGALIWILFVLGLRKVPTFWNDEWIMFLTIAAVLMVVGFLFSCLVRGVLVGFAVGTVHKTWPAVAFSWSRVRRRFIPAVILCLLSSTATALRGSWIPGLLFGATVILWLGLGFDEVQATVSPNGAVWRAFITCMITLLVPTALGTGLELMGVARVLGTNWIYYGCLLGAANSLYSGGLFLIQHVLLRFALRLEGCAPLKYVNFLDYATERIFLRRVGGGYVFLHRTLMEHLATYDPVKVKTISSYMPSWVLRPIPALLATTILLVLITFGVRWRSPHADNRILAQAVANHDSQTFLAELKKGYAVDYANALDGKQTRFLSHTAAAEGETDVLRALLDTGLHVDVRDADGATALHKAVEHGRSAAVKLLLERGADVNAQDHRVGIPSTPLMAAIRHKDSEMVTILLQAGAQPDKEAGALRPLDVAAFDGDDDIVGALLNAGAVPEPALPYVVEHLGHTSTAALLTTWMRQHKSSP